MHIIGEGIAILMAVALAYLGYCMVTHRNPFAPFMKKPPKNPFG